jgi:hypothetical protein
MTARTLTLGAPQPARVGLGDDRAEDANDALLR